MATPTPPPPLPLLQKDRRISKHRKVRTGCEACKRRRVKCNEAHPVCANCAARGHTCIYRQDQPRYPIFPTYEAPLENIDTIRFSAHDLGLMHHWTTATASTIGGSEELRVALRESLPPIALGTPYLLHMVLAVSALHIAYLHPDQAEVYTTLGKYHYSVALPLFRASLPFIDKANCTGLYGCSQLIVKYLFAVETQPARLFFLLHEESIAETLALVQGAYLIRDKYTDWIKQGPLACAATNLFDETAPAEHSPYDANLLDLSAHIHHTLASDVAARATCAEALQVLRDLFARVAGPARRASTKALWVASLARMPRDFFALVRARKPEALVLLAHFCIVLDELNNDGVWYMRGWSRSLFDECVRHLDDHWARYLAWPSAVFAGKGGALPPEVMAAVGVGVGVGAGIGGAPVGVGMPLQV